MAKEINLKMVILHSFLYVYQRVPPLMDFPLDPVSKGPPTTLIQSKTTPPQPWALPGAEGNVKRYT